MFCSLQLLYIPVLYSPVFNHTMLDYGEVTCILKNPFSFSQPIKLRQMLTAVDWAYTMADGNTFIIFSNLSTMQFENRYLLTLKPLCRDQQQCFIQEKSWKFNLKINSSHKWESGPNLLSLVIRNYRNALVAVYLFCLTCTKLF